MVARVLDQVVFLLPVRFQPVRRFGLVRALVAKEADPVVLDLFVPLELTCTPKAGINRIFPPSKLVEVKSLKI